MFVGVPAEFGSCPDVAHLDSVESHHEYVVSPACHELRLPDWLAAAAAAQIALLVCCVGPETYPDNDAVHSLSVADQAC